MSDKAQTVMEALPKIQRLIRESKSDSLIDYTQPLRVSPNAIIDQRAAQLPYIDEILHTALNIFTGYYLQAVSLSVNVGNVDVIRLLDKLSPNRTSYNSESRESNNPPIKESFSVVSGDIFQLPGAEIPDGYAQEDVTLKDSSKTIGESTDLSVGKLVEVNIESEGQKASFQVSVRMHSTLMKPSLLVNTLSIHKDDDNFKERYHKWKMGHLRFVKDVILAQDLIEQHRKNLIEDESGYYQSRAYQRRKNQVASVINQNLSVGTASSIFVMTNQSARELERELKGSLSRYADRQKMFKETQGMLLFIIDPDWEQVTVYHRSIEQPNEISIKEIQRSHRKGGGPDISEMMNAFRQGQSPRV